MSEINTETYSVSELVETKCDYCTKDVTIDNPVIVFHLFKDEILEYFYCGKDCMITDQKPDSQHMITNEATIKCKHIDLEFVEFDKDDLMIRRCLNCEKKFYIILCDKKKSEQ